MSKMKRVKELLNERGVKWVAYSPHYIEFRDKRGEVAAVDERNPCLTLRMMVTPEHAIDLTLGREDSYSQDEMEAQFVHGYTLGCGLNWNENERELEEEMAELGWERKRGTCHIKEAWHWYENPEGFGLGYSQEQSYDCDECGYRHYNSDVRYCSGCGRKVMDE